MEPEVEVSPSPPCDATVANSEQKSTRGAYRSRCKPSGTRPFETGIQEAAPPAEPLREPCQFDYDRARYPFAELVAEALGLSDPTALATFARCPEHVKPQSAAAVPCVQGTRAGLLRTVRT